MEVGALVLCGGTDYFDPATGKNPLGYKVYPNVVTSLEFERIFSGSGPSQGKLIRPYDGKPIRKVAWIQCVGSRDLQTDADFCSNICCMYAVKEALVAKEKTNGELDTTIFYMDMRTFGKSYQRYRDQAETVHGVNFKRGRVHSVTQDQKSGDLVIRYADQDGAINESHQDMVVLSVGQTPAQGTGELSEMLGTGLNPWGFAETEPFSLNKTDREGILIGGSFAGLKDIKESVIQASAASLSASRVIHASGGGLSPEPESLPETVDVSFEVPRILVALCTCKGELSETIKQQEILSRLQSDLSVDRVELMEQTCTGTGWESLVKLVEEQKPNRLLIGACLPYVYARKLRELAGQVGLSPSLMEVVDIRTPSFSFKDKEDNEISALMISALQMGIARLKRVDPASVITLPINQQALVIGGGVAGITAALAIADHGFQVNLIEKAEQLGGNLLWIKSTLEGHTTQAFRDEILQRVEKHPLIQIHTDTQVVASYGDVGRFFTSIEDSDGTAQSLEHGVTILSTGGTEAGTESYGHGTNDRIVTQKELQTMLNEDTIKPEGLKSVVMIQCVDSREEPRNYCSRICCSSALKHALHLKEQNPATDIYILNRDIMSYGFNETYYTQARRAGVFFIQYGLENKPKVDTKNGSVQVNVFEPIIGQEIQINPDLVVLATGIVPSLPVDLAETFGCSLDRDGFFEEAEPKWRPVDSLKEGVFACGIAHSPRSISEAVTTAEAAAQRSLRILTQKNLPAGKVVAKVRHSLCSLCERCIDACPYGARVLDEDLEQVVVNPIMCQGCGSCATVCPNSASILDGFQKEQMFEVIDAALT